MPRARATFNGKVIAEADTSEFVEGNVYVCYTARLQIPSLTLASSLRNR